MTASALSVAVMFAERYYKVLEMAPQALYRFYNEQSSVSINFVDANGVAHSERASGLGAIAEKFTTIAIRGAVATTQHLDAQHSAAGGIVLQVTGAMKMQGQDHKFTQSFFLAPQENGFFVLNDIMRIEPVQYAAAAPAPVSETSTAVPASEQAQRPAAVPQQPPSPISTAPHAYDPAPVQQQQQQKQQAVAPAPEPAVAAAAVHDVEVPQPAKQATPPRPVAPPAPANLTYAQRVRLSSAAAAGATSSPVPAEVLPPAAEVYGDSAEAAEANASANGHVEPKQQPQQVYGVFCKGLPQTEVTVEMLEAEFSKFGPLLGGRQGIVIVTPKFGAIKTAQIKFEDASGMDAALRGDVMITGKRLILTRLRPDFGPPPRGGGFGSGRGGPGGRFGSGNARIGGGRGYDMGSRGGRGERAERPEGSRVERHVRSSSSEHPEAAGHPNGPPLGAGSHERSGSGGGRDERRERSRPADRDRRPGSNSRRGGGRSGGGGGGMSQSSSKDDVAQPPAAAAAAAPEQ